MALMLSKLYDALRAGGVPEDKAREAAEEVATYEVLKQDTRLLKWMTGILTALVLGVFWMQWQILGTLADIDNRLGSVEERLASVEERLTDVEARLGALESGFRELREGASGIERRLDSFEQRLPRS